MRCKPRAYPQTWWTPIAGHAIPGGIIDYAIDKVEGQAAGGHTQGISRRSLEILGAQPERRIEVERYEMSLPSLNDIFVEEVSRARSAL